MIEPPAETSIASSQPVKELVKMLTETEVVVAQVLAVVVVPRDLDVAGIVTAVPASREHCPLHQWLFCI